MKGKWIYIFCFLSLLTAIVLFNTNYYVAGTTFLVLGLYLMPLISELLSQKTGIPFRGTTKNIFAIILFLVGSLLIGNTREKIIERKNKQANNLLQLADSLIGVGKYKESTEKVREAKLLYSNGFIAKADVYESELANLTSEDFLKTAYASMNDETFNLLEDNKNFDKVYFHTSSINDAFIDKLYENRSLRSSIIEEKREKERLAKIEAEKRRKEAELKRKEEEKAQKEAEKLARKLYEKVLRNNWLDAGLDIKVEVKGSNYDRLVLTYVLFNDVWYRKFQTEGLIDGWHDMGFNRIDIKDGYNYYKYYYW